MTTDLIKAHQDMGKAVMKAYRFDQEKYGIDRVCCGVNEII